MQFDIMSLFSPNVVNRLMQPFQTPGAPQNMLANAVAPQTDPWASLRASTQPQMQPQGVDPMQTAAVAPQQVQMMPPGRQGEIRKGPDGKNYQYAETSGMQGASGPQGWIPTSQEPSGNGFMDKLRAFGASDMGGRLNDMFTGWAMGATPQDSIGKGAFMVNQGNQTRQGQKRQNETVEWLKGQGMDADQARLVAGQPAVLSEFLKQKFQQADPMDALRLEKTQLEIDAMRNPKPDGPQSPVGKIQADFAAGLIDGPTRDALILKAGQSEGMEIVSDGQGGFTMRQGLGVTSKPLTEGQSKDTTYATRARGALPLIDQYGGALLEPGSAAAGSVPVVGNFLKSDNYQRAEQAGTEFLQAILRKDTGAAITPQETEEYGKVYLPRPGDGPKVLEQKKASRKRALNAIEAGLPPQAILAQEAALAKDSAADRDVVDYRDFFGGQ